MTDRPVLIVSNRGPVSFGRDSDGGLVHRRGGGGLVSGLKPIVDRTNATWISAALGEDDRAAVGAGLVDDLDGPPVRMVDIDPEQHSMAYNVIANATLWYAHHHLWDLARLPRFDHHFHTAWDAYRSVNEAFASAVAEQAEPGSLVLIQDLHLTLMGRFLAAQRPDIESVHFSHTPFGSPDMIDVLPTAMSAEMIEGMASHSATGFHTSRWESAFTQSAAARSIDPGRTFVSPLTTDVDDILAVARGDACESRLAALEAVVGDRHVIARVDRIELSKNLLRGFRAFDTMLGNRADLRERVVFVASVYPSREGLADYLSYRNEVEGLVERINDRWATADWTPILLDTDDHFPSSVAVLRRYDTLLVNPIRDGLNLVAKEGPIVNERHGTVLLSRQAGVWEELSDHVTEVHPYDVTSTALSLAESVDTAAEIRERTAASLRSAATARTPIDWFDDQVALLP